MKYMVGDILANVKNGIIVHGCNAQGVMGGGIALQVKQMYPQSYACYVNGLKRMEEADKNPMGKVFFNRESKDLYVANAITQDKFGRNKRHVDYEAVAKAFERIRYVATNLSGEMVPIHYPLIGAGLAGGNWNIIQCIIEETLSGLDHTCWTLN